MTAKLKKGFQCSVLTLFLYFILSRVHHKQSSTNQHKQIQPAKQTTIAIFRKTKQHQRRPSNYFLNSKLHLNVPAILKTKKKSTISHYSMLQLSAVGEEILNKPSIASLHSTPDTRIFILHPLFRGKNQNQRLKKQKVVLIGLNTNCSYVYCNYERYVKIIYTCSIVKCIEQTSKKQRVQ